MIFDNSFTESKDLLNKYTEFWDAVKYKIKKINGDKKTEYGKDYIKLKFKSDDDLPLNKPLIFYEIQIFVGFVFKKDGKL